MEKRYEVAAVQMTDGTVIYGNVFLHDKNRLSDLFNDGSIYFIVMENAVNNRGVKKDKIFLNKEQIIWAAPKDVRHSAQRGYVDNTEYVEILIRTVKGDKIDGRINLQVFRNLDDMLRYTSHATFVILINAQVGSGDLHHTLIINKTSIFQIETGSHIE